MVKNLTDEQKNILFKEATESPGTSPLNYEKRLGDYYCVGCGIKLFESSKNTIVDLVGLHFLNLCQTFLKLKLITILATREQNIIAKNVKGITDIFSTMDLNLRTKGIVITELV